MDWKISNALSRDVERQQLNKVLADIRTTVDNLVKKSGGTGNVSLDALANAVEGNVEEGISVTYNPINQTLDFVVNNFTIRLTGDVTGEAEVRSLGSVTLSTELDPALIGVEEAPVDNQTYWRKNEEWEPVPDQIFSFMDLKDEGIPVMYQDDVSNVYTWTIRIFETKVGELTVDNPTGENGNPTFGLADVTDTNEGSLRGITRDSKGRITGTTDATITGTANQIDIANGDAVSGPPTVSLSDLPDTGVGAGLVKITRDSKGRVEGTEAATTDDLAEGATNLYFTEERAQDAIGNAVALGTMDGGDIIYDDVSNSISFTNTDKGSDAVTAHEAEADPHPQYLQSGDESVQSVNGETGVVILDASDVGADPAGSAAAAQAYAVQRGNHTGSQAASTISDFADTVRATVLTGLSTATNAAIAATDTVLQALGKLQAQVSGKASLSGGNTFSGEQTVTRNSGPGFASQSDTALQVVGQDARPARINIDAYGSFPVFQCRRANGTATSPSEPTNLTPLAGFGASGYQGGGFTTARGNFNIYADGNWGPTNHGTFLGVNLTANGATSQTRVYELRSDKLISGSDNSRDLGDGSYRWKEIFCANGTINTSDAREKTTPRHLTPDELAAALDIARLPCVFQWLHAIEEKGEAARLHCSPTVQSVIAVMEAHNLDPFRYGFVCYDEWDEQPEVTETEPAEYDDEGNLIREEQTVVVQEHRPAGNRYSLRPSELAHFIQSAIVQRQDNIEARLNALESK